MSDHESSLLTNNPEYIRVQIELIQAKTRGQELDNNLARSLSETARFAADTEAVKAEWTNAAPSRHRFLYLTGEITSNTTAATIDTLSRWDRIDLPGVMFTIVLCSPGGEVTAGFQLYSYLKGLSERRPLRISAAGICASMATIIHQAASENLRIIEPGCTYLLHKVSGGVGGRIDTITDTAAWMEQLNHQTAEIFAERGNYTVEQVDANIDRRELFLTPDQVVNEWGLADAIEHVS